MTIVSARERSRFGGASRAVTGLTALQGQYLAFIRAYTLINREPPAEGDMQRYFCVTQPSVHKMVLALEKRGAVSRVRGTARSIRILVAPDDIPALEERASPLVVTEILNEQTARKSA
jgi:DNA-binding MarR family transcriptional regulator